MTEWVVSLSERKKWFKERKNFKLVMLYSLLSHENQRAQWPLARVLGTYPGFFRSVRIQIGENS